MNSDVPSPTHKPRSHRAILAFRSVVFWVTGIPARWNRMSHRRALQRLEDLNHHALRDIGLWREPESRLEDWWRTNPPP